MLSSSRNEHPTHPLPVDQHLEDETGPREECGVFGVWAPGEEVAKLTYFGLYALQHRGQEAAGIAVSDGRADRGLQGHGPGLPGLRRADAGSPARATSRSATPATPPPAPAPGRTPSRRSAPPRRAASIALGHNGNLINTARAARRGRGAAPTASRPRSRRRAGHHRHRPGHRAARRTTPTSRSRRPRCEVLPQLRGAFSLRLHGRGHPVRRPRPAGHPPAGARPARARLGGRLARPPRWTSSARASSARSSPAS